MDMEEANKVLYENQLKNLTLICSNTLEIVGKQPTRDDMVMIAENAALKAVETHRDGCDARAGMPGIIERTTDSTTRIKLLTDVKNSIAPFRDSDSRWVKLLKTVVPILVGAVLSALGVSQF
jgi:hypothetical protein